MDSDGIDRAVALLYYIFLQHKYVYFFTIPDLFHQNPLYGLIFLHEGEERETDLLS